MPQPPPRANSSAAKSIAKTKVSGRIIDEAGGANAKLTPVAAHFWKHKTLEELNSTEWESLCDGCGRCCLVKLEDEASGIVHFTDVACKLFDSVSCRCMDYARRLRKVRDCIRLTPAKVRALSWLPPSCAYRLVAEGRDLPKWHPLVSGSKASVHEARVSVRGRVTLTENEVAPDDYPSHIVAWPGNTPRRRAAAARKAKI